MNPTTTSEQVRESEYVLRRLGESFSQFRTDLWESVPVWLLAAAALAVVARVWYGRYHRKAHPHAKPDAAMFWLGWAAVAAVGAFVAWTLVVFFQKDTAQTKAGAATLSALGQDNATLWYAFTGGVFALGSAFVIWMYIRDARSVRWYWAAKLALLRITVYALLCFVFLLPARQTWERTEKQSRVVVLVDISPSMTRVSDDPARKGSRQKKRMETLIELLTDKDVALIQNILKTNPVAVYPFGTRLDESARTIKRDQAPWGKEEWEALAAYDFRPFLAEGLSDAGKEALRNTTDPEWSGPKVPAGERPEPPNWADWARQWFDRRGKPELVNGMTPADTAALRENLNRLERRIDVARSIALGTNVPDSVAAAVNRESPNMVQGVIVLSDGRSNLGSDSSYRELKAAAAREKVPVFMVAVGEERQNTAIAITDVQADDVVSPDEGFKVTVEVDGTNLAGKTVPVELEVYLPGNDPTKKEDAKPDYTFRDSRPDKTRGSPTPYTVTFAPGDPPHGSVDVVVDPAKLAADPDPAARALVTESKDAAFKKPVLKETPPKTGWTVRARIPRDENEPFPDDFHVRDRAGISVLQKKLRVLLVASAPSREFHFLRTFLNREVAEQRAALTLFVQNEAGTTGFITPNQGESVIQRWPTELDVSGKPSADAAKNPKENLNEYDVVVAFDPDWSGPDLNDPWVKRSQADDLKSWVERQGGGFVLVADRINTYQLARVEKDSRLSPVLDVLPVEPDDVIALRARPTARDFRRLYLSPMPGSDLLKIDDPPAPEKKDGKEPENDPVAGWEAFFTGGARDKYVESKDLKVELFPRNGFYSCYPVKGVKAGAKVLAEFADLEVVPGGTTEKVLRPWLVVSNPAAGFRTAYMGSGEIFRMYAYDKEYYERYWAKLLKYMAAKRNVKASRGRVLTSKEVISGTPIRVTAQLLDPGSRPYAPGAVHPKFSVVRVEPGGAEKREGPFEMTPTGVEGYFKGQTAALPAQFPVGEQYFAEVEVPDSAGEKLRSPFRVTKSDLEMNVTGPDFPRMVEMAGALDEAVQGRVSAQTRKTLSDTLPKEGGVSKLAFKLGDRNLVRLIPEFFKTDSQRFDTRGPVDDLWDEKIKLFDVKDPGTQEWLERRGFRNRADTGERPATTLSEFVSNGPRMFRASREEPPEAAARSPAMQVAVSWVVVALVFLLGWEWLTRKLLRLA